MDQRERRKAKIFEIVEDTRGLGRGRVGFEVNRDSPFMRVSTLSIPPTLLPSLPLSFLLTV